MGSTGTVRTKVSASMRAASLELSGEGGRLCLPHQSTATCPHLPPLLSTTITSTFRRENHPPNGLGGLGAWGSCCPQGHTWARGCSEGAGEGSRGGGVTWPLGLLTPRPPGELLGADRERQEGCSLAPFLQPSPSFWGLRLARPWRGEWGPYCGGSVIMTTKAFLHFHSFCTLS